MRHLLRRRSLSVCVAMIALIGVSLAMLTPLQSAPHIFDTALRRAQASSAHHFTADIVQRTIPEANVINVGRQSRQDALYLEGQSDRTRRALSMRLWTKGGTVLDLGSGAEIKVENDLAFARQGDGEWQPLDNFTGLFAPQGNLLAFMSAAKDITEIGSETRAGTTYTRFGFTVDGPAFAGLVRDQLQRALAEQNKLPAGVNLDLPAVYRDMTGDGELWVGADGLPYRQLLHLRLPPAGGNDRIEADITIDFSRFESPPPSSWAMLLSGKLPPIMSMLPSAQHVQTAAALLLAAACCALLLHYGRSRRLLQTLSLTLIFAVVVTPLLQNLKVAEFNTAQAAEASTQQQNRATNDATSAGATFDPQTDPVRVATTGQPASGFLPFSTPRALDDPTDTDGDGLTDAVEQRLGTIVDLADSDNDGVPDAKEARGFAYRGQTWYLNPREADTNNDGLPDGREWRRDGNLDATPDDTDGDGTPDLLDDDNDGDGVDDAIDLSPLTKNGTYSPSRPLSFRLPDLSADRLAYVEFQVRPADPRHLSYALNVLDWPYDGRGNIQDGNGGTFADNGIQGLNAANGDVRLVPMLEIRADTANNANPSNIPDQETLKPYGISIRDLNTAGTKGVYVPLSLVADSNNTRAAFNGKMVYRASGTWNQPHTVRLVWVVQMLSDECVSYQRNITQSFPNVSQPVVVDQVSDPTCQSYNYGQLKVIHTYGDDWTLTGLNVREDHGTDTSIIYEDPAVDPDPSEDTAIMGAATALEQTFLAGRDGEARDTGNGKRDIAVTSSRGDTTIAQRLDRDLNNDLSDDQRWHLPDRLKVRTLRYSHRDLAQAEISTREAPDILNGFNRAAKPSLLFAREEHFRATNLDTLVLGQGQWTDDNTTLTLNVRGTHGDQPVQTLALLNLAPYCNTNNAWAACSPDAYWSELQRRYNPAIQALPEPEREYAQGQATLAMLYTFGLQRGLTNVVQRGLAILPTITVPDKPVGAGIALVGSKGVVYLVNTTVVKQLQNNLNAASFTTFVKSIGKFSLQLGKEAFVSPLASLVNPLKALFNKGLAGRIGSVSIGALAIVGVVVAVAALATPIILNKFGIGGEAMQKASDIILALIGPTIGFVLVVKDVAMAIKAGNSVIGLLGSASTVLGSSRIAAAIGLVLTIGIAWGVFIYQAASGAVTAGTQAFNTALAGAFAATLIAVFVFIISLTVAGTILVAILGLIDGILAAVCAGLGRQDDWCKGITGVASKTLGEVFYSTQSLVDMTRDDLVQMGAPRTALVNPDAGYVAGNKLKLTIPVKTNVNEARYTGVGYDIGWDIRNTTFKYNLAREQQALNAAPGEMREAWQNVRQMSDPRRPWEETRLHADATTEVSTEIALVAGVNRPISTKLNAGYSIGRIDRVLMAIGTLGKIDGNFTTPLDDLLVVDVLPATLDEFYALERRDGGYRLAWDEAFTTLRDADGDGLTREIDPNDSTADTDNDGLTDARELELREQGLKLAPDQADSDGDGLSDRAEMRLGTNPGLADSDGDGLSDANETGGWPMTINGQTYHITSDPALADSDGDGLSDRAEKNLAGQHYNPRVADVTFSVSGSTDDVDRIVGRNQRVAYRATITNQQTAKWASGTFRAVAPDSMGGVLIDQTVSLTPQSETTLTGGFTVPGDATTQVVEISSSAALRLGSADGSGEEARQQDTLRLVVDADAPSVRFSSLADGQALSSSDLRSQTLIIGGAASDPSSPVSLVEVSVNDGAWQAANGTSSWAFPLLIAHEGRYALRARATDAVGNQTISQIGVVVDNTAPQVSSAAGSGSFTALRNQDQGRWGVNLSGTVSDPAITANGQNVAGSGVASVDVQLVGHSSDARGNGWQRAVMRDGAWNIQYAFPIEVQDPNGQYSFLVRSTDRSGNQSAPVTISGTMLIDSTPATASLGYGAIIPTSMAYFKLDEAVNATSFEDASGRQTAVTCVAGTCPATGVAGRIGQAAAFDGSDDYLNVTRNPLLTLNTTTIATWFKTPGRTDDHQIIFGDQNTDGPSLWSYRLVIDPGTGLLRFDFHSPGGYFNIHSGVSVSDDQWHHVAVTRNAKTRTVQIYVDGILRATQSYAIAIQNTNNRIWIGRSPVFGGHHAFRGLVDELAVFDRVLTPAEVQMLAHPLPEGAALLMPFDEGVQQFAFGDASSNRVPATCVNANCPAVAAEGVNGKGARFDGTDDYVALARNPQLTLTNATIATWYKADRNCGPHQMLLADEMVGGPSRWSYRLMLTPECRIRFDFMVNGGNHVFIDGNSLINDGRWHHVALTRDDTAKVLRLYFDGTLQATKSYDGTIDNTNNPIWIGRSPYNGGSHPYQGLMDETAIYNRVLSQQEIASLSRTNLTARFPLARNVLAAGEQVSGYITDPGRAITGMALGRLVIRPTELVDLESSAAASLPLREANGSNLFADSSPRANHARCELPACPRVTDTWWAPSFIFDRVDDALTVGTPEIFRAGRFALTLNAYFNLAYDQKPRTLLSKGSLLMVEEQEVDTNNGRGSVKKVTFAGRTLLTDPNDPCGYCSIMYDGSTLAIYDLPYAGDGQPRLIASQTIGDVSGQVAADRAPLVVGNNAARTAPFGGVIDKVRFFDRALSSFEMSVLATHRGDFNTVNIAFYPDPTEQKTGLWSAKLPAGLTGDYQIDLYTRDYAQNAGYTPNLWRGRIGAKPLQASIRYTGYSWWWWSFFQYQLVVEGYDLDVSRTTFNCYNPWIYWDPRVPGNPEYEYSTWRAPRATRITAYCSNQTPPHAMTHNMLNITACERNGQCVTAGPSQAMPLGTQRAMSRAEGGTLALNATTATPPALVQTEFITPLDSIVLTRTLPMDLSAGVYARDGLQSWNLAANGRSIASQTYGTGTVTSTVETRAWTPPAAGQHRLTSTVRDRNGKQTTDTITATVDLAPPSVTLASNVLTTSTALDGGGPTLRGTATDDAALQHVVVAYTQSAMPPKPAWQPATLAGSSWQASLPVSSGTYTVTAMATDLAGRTTRITNTVTVDLDAPSPPALTPRYVNKAGTTSTITAGMTIRDAAPTLQLDWTASSDPAGIRRYLAGWSTTAPAADAGSVLPPLQVVAPNAQRRVTAQPGEAQTLYGYVVAEDTHGNRRVETFGPVYIDAPTTPDITALDYGGWRASGTTRWGVSRAVANAAGEQAALGDEQRFFGTWDATNLRLGWTGADWETSGDLFIYLDTTSGGATTAYNPFAGDKTTITLPGNGKDRFEQQPLLADYAVWVQSRSRATLMRWNGTAWVVDRHLDAAQFRFDQSDGTATTDLRLPFSLLKLTPTSPLRVVAFASDQNALRLWAAMPSANPLTSDLVDGRGEAQVNDQSITLLHQYSWDSLGVAREPNADIAPDSDVEVWITADKPATTVSFFDDDLYEAWDKLFANDDPTMLDYYLYALDPDLAPVKDGQRMSYTIHYRNHGSEAAEDVSVLLVGQRSLRLDGATREVDPVEGGLDSLELNLGTIAPGATGQKTVGGTIDIATGFRDCRADADTCADLRRLTLLNALLFDKYAVEEDAPLDWVFVQQHVDGDAPVGLSIDDPSAAVRPARVAIEGSVSDSSDVPLIRLEARGGGKTATVSCSNVVDPDGTWRCPIDLRAFASTTSVEIRVQATDQLQNTSAWTNWRSFTVDTAAPNVTLNADSLALGGEVLGVDEEGTMIGGTVADNTVVVGVEVCYVADTGEDCYEADIDGAAGTWSFALDGFAEVDGEPESLRVYAYDEAGNRSSRPATLTYTVDTIAPEMTVEAPAGTSTQPIFNVKVADGSGVLAVYGVALPTDASGNVLDEEPIYQELTPTGGRWQYAPRLPAGRYTLMVMAFDNGLNTAYVEVEDAFVSKGVPAQSGKVYLPLVRR